MTVRPITGRSVVVTGTGRLADGLVDGLDELGVDALPLDCDVRVGGRGASPRSPTPTRASAASTRSCTPGSRRASSRRTAFVDLDEDEWAAGCERSLAAAWWLARASAEPLRASTGAWCSWSRPSAWPARPSFTMLAAVAEGMRVLAKGCGRQWGVDGVTVNTIAAAPHHWVDDDTADALTRAISLSTPAFGHPGDAADDLAPLVALLDDPDAHFLTAGTLVADGGTWMGLSTRGCSTADGRGDRRGRRRRPRHRARVRDATAPTS